VGRVLAAGGLILLVGGFALVTKNYGQYVAAAAAGSYEALLIPDDQLATNDDEMAARSADLLARYPRDPRAHLFHALRLANAGDTTAAQAQLRRGLEERDILKAVFPDRRLETAMRSFLAQLLLSQGKSDEAEQAAAPVCSAGLGGAVPDSLRELPVCK